MLTSQEHVNIIRADEDDTTCPQCGRYADIAASQPYDQRFIRVVCNSDYDDIRPNVAYPSLRGE